MTEEVNPDIPKGFSSLVTGTIIPVILFLALLWIGIKFLIPAVDYREISEVRTVTPDKLHDGVNTDWKKDYDFYLVKEGNVLFAVSARDKYAEKTLHQKSLINWNPDKKQFVDQAWGSVYDQEGNAIAGPTTWALDRFGLHTNEMGEVIVDPKIVQNVDGEVRRQPTGYRVEESARRVEPYFLKTQ